MQTKQFLYPFLVVLACLILACGTEAALGQIHFASSVDDQGRPVTETEVFHPGDTVYLSVEMQSVYAGLESTATWKRGDEILETQTVTASRSADTLDPLFVVFQLDTQPDWPAGAYHCELFVPDQGTTTFEFALQ